MVRTKMFDNIMKVYRQQLTVIANVTKSVEMDLEIPRGYIAKIKKVILSCDGNMAVGANYFSLGCINDPDDIITGLVPIGQVKHDVIFARQFAVSFSTQATGNLHGGDLYSEIVFDQELDVVAARNLRFNAVAANATPTMSGVDCHVYYSLEAISDQLILELLDIL